MDPVTEEVEKVKRDFQEAYNQTLKHINSIQEYGKESRIARGGEIVEKTDSLRRLNSLAQDGINLLQSYLFNLDLLAPQLPSPDDVEKAQSLADYWKTEIESLRRSLRNANFQAKANVKKTAQEERELLLGGGKESTARRRDLQTKAGMTSAAQSITESLRRTRQLMVQEVERTTSTLMTIDESNLVLTKAEGEYKGHRSLLARTRNLLSTMQRQDVLDRIILVVGFLAFSLAVLYVVSKRIGVLKLQRKVVDAVKSGMAGQELILPFGDRGQNVVPLQADAVQDLNIPIEQLVHDEL